MPAARKRKASTGPPEHSQQQQQSISQHFPTTKQQHTSSTTTATTTKPPPPPSAADYVQVGTHKLRVGQRLLPLVDSTDLYQSRDWHALFSRLDEDGVILVRGVVSTPTVRRARSAILQHIGQKGALVQQPTDATEEVRGDSDEHGDGRALIGKTSDGALTAGWTIDADSGGVNGDREDESATDGWRSLGTSSTLTDVYNGAELKSFLHGLFTAAIEQRRQQYPLYQPSGKEVVTTFPDCTWLRIRGHKDLTIEHTDYYYFKQERSIFSDHWQPTLTTTQPPASPPPPSCTLCSSTTATIATPTVQCALCLHTFHRSCLVPAPPVKPRGGYHCPSCANLPFPFYTCWIALGPVHRQHGRLALVPTTHRLLQGYEDRRGGGDGKLPREWKGNTERSAVWRSSDMEAGDLLLFNVKTVHGASVNVSDEFRISMDTRVTFAERRPALPPNRPTLQPRDGSGQRSVAEVKAESAVDELPSCVMGGEIDEKGRVKRSKRGMIAADAEWKRLQQEEECKRKQRPSKLK